jgi:hypothetical protein
MKLCITSDIHLGDPRCQLISKNGNVYSEGPLYRKFIDAVGNRNDYFILAGDILDFSISNYADSYATAAKFFELIKRDQVVLKEEGKESGMIYICGNHDWDLWHILQHQRSVVKRMESNPPNNLPKDFEHTSAGIIDMRTGNLKKRLSLDRVSMTMRDNIEQYGGLFFDHVTNPPTTFIFAFPNLYIVDDRQCVIVTHGQYFEPAWAFVGELLRIIAKEDLAQYQLEPEGGGEIERMVELNFPANQLLCTGIGQAGVLTKLVRSIEQEVADGKFDRIARYLDHAINEIVLPLKPGWIPGVMAKPVLNGVKKGLLDIISKAGESHLKEGFMNDATVQERFRKFYRYCLTELDAINARSGALSIPPPTRMIFGHTHDPIAWNNTGIKVENIVLSNTGGWVREEKGFHGAEIFTYESEKGFSSISIRE